MNKQLTFLLFILLTACNTSKVKTVSSKPIVDKQLCDSLSKSIETAYQNKSDEGLTAFLDNWNESISNKNESLIKSQIEKDIYAIYKELFKPNTISTICESYFDNAFYENENFFIIQSGVRYDIENERTEEINIDSLPSIWDFRPKIEIDNAKILYLTIDYEKVLTDFLNNNSLKPKSKNLVDNINAKPERYKREDFLETKLKIFPWHWGKNWHLATHPEIEIVYFSSNRKKANVGYRIEYSSWNAEFMKKNGRWTIINIEQTGYE